MTIRELVTDAIDRLQRILQHGDPVDCEWLSPLDTVLPELTDDEDDGTRLITITLEVPANQPCDCEAYVKCERDDENGTTITLHKI